jgi:prolipoprotein diacylglyceryltransferase
VYRVLFEWRGIRIYSYPAMLYLGLVSGVILQTLVSERAGLPTVRIYFATLTLIPIALAGSRVLHVAANWQKYRATPHLIWKRGEGGLAMYGGVPFMIIASIPVLAAYRLPFWTFWDTAVFCIFPGMAFARVGCLLNGCCSGQPTNGRLAMWLPDERGHWTWRVPMQLLELSIAATVLAFAWLTADRFAVPGQLFLSTVIAYAASRLVLQGLRTHRERAARVDLHAAISMSLIVLAITAMYVL